MIITDKIHELVIEDRNWSLAIDLFVKWGYPERTLEQAKKIKVTNVYKVSGELSAWGIPWKIS